MNIVAFDGGFGYIQALVNGERIKFANITGNYRPSDNGLIGGGDNLSIQVDGLGAWNFGNTAVLQSSGGGSRRQSSDRIFTKEFLAGLLLAISEGYSEKRRDPIKVNVITGLPGTEYSQYSNKKDKSYQNKFKKFIQGDYHINRFGHKQRIIINSIQCTNQSWGAIWRHLFNEHGDPVKPDVKSDVVQFASSNIGYRTVENGTVEIRGIQSNNFIPQQSSDKQKSTPKGVHTIVNDLVSDLQDRFNVSYTDEKALEIMESGYIIVDGEEMEYKLPDSIVDNFSRDIFNLATQVWDNELRGIYQVLLTGGGANIVRDRFSSIPQLLVSDEPQWDTVEGYGRLAKHAMKRSK